MLSTLRTIGAFGMLASMAHTIGRAQGSAAGLGIDRARDETASWKFENGRGQRARRTDERTATQIEGNRKFDSSAWAGPDLSSVAY